MAAILIVDDSPTVRADLAAALERAGFATLPCETLAEARIALRSHPIALVILDVQLPDGDGVELLVQIRKDGTLGDLPVLMLSTEAEIAGRIRELMRELRRGPDGF
ncbi:MAG TPA: response regulator, partial [Kofleriaceae bacterium]